MTAESQTALEIPMQMVALGLIVLAAHLGVADSLLEDTVFPNSRQAVPWTELIRTT